MHVDDATARRFMATQLAMDVDMHLSEGGRVFDKAFAGQVERFEKWIEGADRALEAVFARKGDQCPSR